jgi:hypothetical protein
VVTSVGQFAGFYYLVDFAENRPLQAYAIDESPVVFSKISPSGEFIAQAFENGDLNVRLMDQPDKFLNFHMHDSSFGKIV